MIFMGSDARNRATEGDTRWMKKKTSHFQFTFNGLLKVAFQGSRVTSDAGLILVRERCSIGMFQEGKMEIPAKFG